MNIIFHSINGAMLTYDGQWSKPKQFDSTLINDTIFCYLLSDTGNIFREKRVCASENIFFTKLYSVERILKNILF